MDNLLSLANYAIASQAGFDGYLAASTAKKSYYDANFPDGTSPGVGRYTQTNMLVTLTENGVRLYSPPNTDATGNGWGGLCLSPMKASNCLIKNHRYIMLWHCSGKTSTGMGDTYWSNQIGWGQSPDANPTVNGKNVPSAGFQGEMECFYDFTISDDIFKTTGDSVHSGFEANTTYLAYAAFKIGFGYRQTGALGTDLYLTNFRMYDITNGFQQCQYTKQGILDTTEVIELPSSLFTNAQIQKSGNIIISNLYEI